MLRQAQQINTQCGPYRHLENLHLVGGGGGEGPKVLGLSKVLDTNINCSYILD